MNPLIIPALMTVAVAGAAVSLWHSASAINQMSPRTNNWVRWAYILKACGYFAQTLAVFDYLHGDPLAWPWLLLTGIAIGNSGSALLHFTTRRACRCSECPLRAGLGDRACS